MPRIPDPIWWWLRAFPRRLYAVLFLAMQVLIAVLTTIHPLIVTVVAAQGGIIFLYANDHHLGMRDSERAAYFSGLGSVLPGYALVVHGWWWPLAVMWGGLGPVFLAERLMDWDY